MTAANRPRTLGIVLAILSLPALLALVDAESFHLANRSNGSFVSSGETREYLLHVPRSYDHTRATPLVISMHGAGLWPAAQQEISRWSEEAEREGFIVVYPSGVEGHGPRIWRADGGAGLRKDVRFISALIDTLEAAYHIDPARIYVNGLSNGGHMSFVLSCTMSDRIAAVGMVGAAHLLPWSWCTDHRPVPMIAFHGTADQAAPYNGGTSWVATERFPSIPGWTANWARRNGCGARPVESAVAADVTRIEYLNCADSAAVVLYRVQGGGHTWPSGGPLPEWLVGSRSNGVDATREMWRFFREHSLREALIAPRSN
jgi:polyhydroxybutyrate depolymerase